MEKNNKEVVTPIDEKEWMTEEEIQEQEEIKQLMKPWKEHSTGSKIFGIVFIIWFIGSIVAMIVLSNMGKGEYTVMLFGQYFLVFGIMAFFGKSVDGSNPKPIGLIFASVGLGCIIIPFFIMHPELLPTVINWETVGIISFLMLFIVVGVAICLSLLKQKGNIIPALIFAGFFILFPGIALSVFISQKPEFIVKDQIKLDDEQDIEDNDEPSYYDDTETSYKEYRVGEKVTVKLNNVLEQDFYVLKNSTEDDSTVLLFATKNIGYSAFNNNFTDGNEFEGSLIQTTLNDLTKNWTNVKEKRLIKVEEILETGLIHEERESRCPEGNCEAVYTYVNEDSFFYNENEFYWTMTHEEDSTNDKGYVYMVSLGGSIEAHIVGYTPGGEWNQDGNFFQNFGIRPVIEIDKEYIK